MMADSKDEIDEILHCPLERLKRLLELPESPVWAPSDFRQILAHQLQSSAREELEIWAKDEHIDATRWSSTLDGLNGSLREVLLRSDPPVAVLRLIKEFAKSHRSREVESHLPREVASVIYYAAISAALLRTNERITDLGTTALCQGLDWVLRQEWIDDALRPLFLQAAQRLGTARTQD